jgi:transposase-like protein
MKAMAKHRSHSIEFKRQIAQEFIAGETLHALAKRYDLSRNLIRIWVNLTASRTCGKTLLTM